ACAWVGAGAGMLPRSAGVSRRVAATRRRSSPSVGRVGEVVLLSIYGVAASYAFGLIMNLWFWPFAVGGGTGISYESGAPLAQNLASFWLYSLTTSTLTWDTLRAVTTVVGLTAFGPAALAALRRVRLAPAAPAVE
ncbi:MAG TPA: hypothetical protein VGE78_08310, partial [Agromyces sp.]